MATLTIYADASDGSIISYGANYTAARNGTGTKSLNGYLMVGQDNVGGANCYEAFTQYNTSPISNSTITSVTESLFRFSDSTTTDFTQEVRAYDWGSTLETADYIAGANLASYPLLTSKIVSPSAGYNVFPSTSEFIASINKSGYTRLVHSSNRTRLNNAPSGNEYVVYYQVEESGTTKDPKLLITYDTFISGQVSIEGAGEITASGNIVVASLNFLTEPTVTIRAPIATHITVSSPTHSYTAVISPTPSEATKIERGVDIEAGDASVCQSIAEELLGKWGREQVSVTGVIPLDMRFNFMEELYIVIPQAGISRSLVLQRKEHDIIGTTTSIVCGDIILDDSELLARILQDLLNK